jgi:hypothetical protein
MIDDLEQSKLNDKRTKLSFHFIATTHFVHKTTLESVHIRIELVFDDGHEKIDKRLKSN